MPTPSWAESSTAPRGSGWASSTCPGSWGPRSGEAASHLVSMGESRRYPVTIMSGTRTGKCSVLRLLAALAISSEPGSSLPDDPVAARHLSMWLPDERSVKEGLERFGCVVGPPHRVQLAEGVSLSSSLFAFVLLFLFISELRRGLRALS